MELTFTSTECMQVATELNDSAAKIGQLFGDFEELINSVANNYRSETSNEIVAKFNKVNANGEAFRDAIASCSRYLTEEVAPAYEKLETTAQSKVSGV